MDISQVKQTPWVMISGSYSSFTRATFLEQGLLGAICRDRGRKGGGGKYKWLSAMGIKSNGVWEMKIKEADDV